VKKIIILLSCLTSFSVFSGKITEGRIEKICKHYKTKVEFRDFKYSCNLILSLAFVESRYKPYVFNPEKTGSYGLMQIQCDTAKMVGLKYNCDQLFDPPVNIRFGMKYLLWLKKTRYTPTIRYLIASWNAGKAYICKNLNVNEKGEVLCYPNQFINEKYTRAVYDHYNYLMNKKRKENVKNKLVTNLMEQKE